MGSRQGKAASVGAYPPVGAILPIPGVELFRPSPGTHRSNRATKGQFGEVPDLGPISPDLERRQASREFLEGALEFTSEGDDGYEARGESRGGTYVYDVTEERGVPGAGTVHHVAWASTPEEHEAWRQRVIDAGGSPTPVIDRFYFKSIYFREPSGVLFEIATIGPGFTADEPLETLGERLSLPPNFEHLREQVEPVLTPISNPRESWAAR